MRALIYSLSVIWLIACVPFSAQPSRSPSPKPSQSPSAAPPSPKASISYLTLNNCILPGQLTPKNIVPFNDLFEGEAISSSIKVKENSVLTYSELEQFWYRAFAEKLPPNASAQTAQGMKIVLLYPGPQPSTNNAICIKSIERTSSGLNIQYQVGMKTMLGGAAQAYPYKVILIPETEDEVTITEISNSSWKYGD